MTARCRRCGTVLPGHDAECWQRMADELATDEAEWQIRFAPKPPPYQEPHDPSRGSLWLQMEEGWRMGHPGE